VDAITGLPILRLILLPTSAARLPPSPPPQKLVSGVDK
jgi:hypothetical protein